jgi:hypothetical protein
MVMMMVVADVESQTLDLSGEVTGDTSPPK